MASRIRTRNLFLIGVATILSACQLQPTKVYQTSDVDPRLLIKNAERPLVLEASTVVVDARSSFEFAMLHVPGSINLQWEEFARPRSSTPGKLTGDLAAAARRLALFGIGPGSKVVVVGMGKAGQGEEGRLAWTLYYLGVRDVQVAAVSYFKAGLTNAQPPPHENAKLWSPRPVNEIEASRDELLAVATSKLEEGQRPPAYIIDVRTRQEYFSRQGFGQGYATPELRAIHIPFQEFFLEDGRVNIAMREKLQSIGVGLHDRVIVISNRGVRSGAVTFAMLSMGFLRAANYSGGYSELVGEKSR